MISSSIRSERGWWDRRRIVVLVSVVAVFGVISLGSASTASAVIPAHCAASLTPKSKSNPGQAAKLNFVCDGVIRAYGLASNKRIKDYAPAPTVGGAPSAFMSCEGTGVGFGCGVVNRATPGFQDPGTTGWKAQPVPPFPSATTVPTTCGGFRRVATSPNRDGVVGPACTQLIPAGAPVSQSVKLGFNPCAVNQQNPAKVYLFAGGEPPTTSFTVAGDSTGVGESISPPYPVKLKGYGGCEIAPAKKSAKSAAATTSNFPISCRGTVEPAVAGQKNHDAKFIFTCSQNIRAFGIYSNRQIDLGAEEPTVVGVFGGGQTESALHQCEGFYPGPGFGCGITNRQEQTASLPNGQGVSGGNFAEARFGFLTAPCNGKNLPKPRVWVVPMGEPVIGAVVGEYIGAPQPIAVTGWGKCKEPKKK